MPAAAYARGDVLLAWLAFSDGQASKRRPVLVVYDFGDDWRHDIVVEKITPAAPSRGSSPRSRHIVQHVYRQTRKLSRMAIICHSESALDIHHDG